VTYTYTLPRRLASAHDVQRDARRIVLLLLLLLAVACGAGDLTTQLAPPPVLDPAAPDSLNLSPRTPGTFVGAFPGIR